jgi:hypothetical protein
MRRVGRIRILGVRMILIRGLGTKCILACDPSNVI